MRIIEPPKSSLHTLRPPLTAGEARFLEVIEHVLPNEWECYIQPHLNGLRPDFVLLNPAVGIAVYEIKDWNLEALRYEYRKNEKTKSFELWAQDGNRWFAKSADDPLRKVELYKREIWDLYCPSFQDKSQFGRITAGVVFPYARRKSLLALMQAAREDLGQTKYAAQYPLLGSDDLLEAAAANILPASRCQIDNRMSEQIAAELRHWLIEPEHQREQRTLPKLNENQKNLVRTRTPSGYRRIKGPAGSGKSIVMAGRAAQLAREGKRVLVATYNITLLNYLRDQAVRFGLKRNDRNVEWLNFHYWCKRICLENGFASEYALLWGGRESPREVDDDDLDGDRLEEVLNEKMAQLARQVASSPGFRKYDAILVDEGQDYLPSWWQALRAALSDGGEALLVADLTQNVYGTAQRWTDKAMNDMGFIGGTWSRLDGSYRLPTSVRSLVLDFAGKYLSGGDVDLPHSPLGELDLSPCAANWVQVAASSRLPEVLFKTFKNALQNREDGPAVSDITILVQSNETGWRVCELLSNAGIEVSHTFVPPEFRRKGRNELGRKLKLRFYKGAATVKATTILSYKGWESPVLIVVLDRVRSPQQMSEAYVALTRISCSSRGGSLTVLCAEDGLREFGQSWPNYSVM